MNEIQQVTGLQIPPDITSLQTDTITVYEAHNVEEISTTDTDKLTQDNGGFSINDTNLILGVVIGVLLLSICILMSLYIYRKKKHRGDIKDIEEGYGHKTVELNRVGSETTDQNTISPMSASESPQRIINTNDMDIAEDEDGYPSGHRQPGQTITTMHKQTDDDLYGPGLDRVGSNITDRGIGNSVASYNDNENDNENGASLPQYIDDEQENDGTHSGDDLYQTPVPQVRTDDGFGDYGSDEPPPIPDENENDEDDGMYENAAIGASSVVLSSVSGNHETRRDNAFSVATTVTLNDDGMNMIRMSSRNTTTNYEQNLANDDYKEDDDNEEMYGNDFQRKHTPFTPQDPVILNGKENEDEFGGDV